jgi:hypothetical protein
LRRVLAFLKYERTFTGYHDITFQNRILCWLCKENAAKQLWLQATMRMPEATSFITNLLSMKKIPKQLTVLKSTEKIMVMYL